MTLTTTNNLIPHRISALRRLKRIRCAIHLMTRATVATIFSIVLGDGDVGGIAVRTAIASI
ncbi:hypothetical protein [Baaleninema simplex]|uniref:hypothetical protein n=1 Tax=Baaleninema simplex TaxID=2862350 RepID=UPI001C554638|nr:hypothetical protein [Baaleninema simplex]